MVYRGRRAAARRGLLALLLSVGFHTAATRAIAADPLATVRAFCLADGRGTRLSPGTWGAVAPFVGWALEPAWDHVYLVHGYELGTPRLREGGLVDVEVSYTVVNIVDSTAARPTWEVMSRTYTLEPAGGGEWRLRPPAPPPHVFESQADPEALAALLNVQDSAYLSNSAFVWRLLRGAGWQVAFARTADLVTAPGYTAQRTANVGDLVVYLADGSPYHVGVVESDEGIVSATLNGGIRRTPFDAFAGEILYLRPSVSRTPTPSLTPDRPATTPTKRRRKK
ncbi:MAG: hypothetical protein AB7V27_10055 [Candidatus Binatia bacterium]